MSQDENVPPPSDRLRTAYDPALYREVAQQAADLLANYFAQATARDGVVLPWKPPAESVADAAAWMQRPLAATDHDSLRARFAALVEETLTRGQHLHHPRYIGHQVPASVPIASLFDSLGAATNQPMAIYEMGPWSTATERALVEELGQRLGFPAGQFAGFITHGGSLANLTALLTARNVALGDSWQQGLRSTGPAPVLVTQADAHYSIARAAGMLGLGAQNVLKVGLDDRRRMAPAALRAALVRCREEQRTVVAVAASCCTTPIGAFDVLAEIAPICREFGVWLHVDAAHGGAACFSPQHAHLLKGIEQADSVVWDAHKMLFVPALCAFVFYRNREHRFTAFQQNAPYLFDPTAPGLADYDIGLQTVECTKRAAAFGLWGLWCLFGPSLFTELVDRCFALGRNFVEQIRGTTDFVSLHDPQCNIVAFRYVPSALAATSAETIGDFQLRLRRSLIESGAFYITATKLDGIGALRVTIINPLTTEHDLAELLQALRRHAGRLLATG